MVDVPTPSEIGKEAAEGQEPRSLGDRAKEEQDPVISDDVKPDPQHSVDPQT